MHTVGVGVFVWNNGKILIGKRGPKCKRGKYCYALPGGHLEKYETLSQCAIREVVEESGILVDFASHDNLSIPGLLGVTECGSTLSFWLETRYISGNPIIREPNKCLSWDWMTIKDVESIIHNSNREQKYWIPIDLWKRFYPNWSESYAID